MRRAVYLAHRYIGLALSLFLLVAAVTGCVLICRDGLDALLNPDLFLAPSAASATGDSTTALLVDRVATEHPDWRVSGGALWTDYGRSLRLTADIDGVARQVFVDPSSGRVLGMRDERPGFGARHLLRSVYLLHCALLIGMPGRWLMGLVAVLWLGLNLLGAWVTLPRRPPLRRWAVAWRSDRAALARRPLVEGHRLSGLWLLTGLTVLAASSAALNFFDEAFRPVVASLSPPQPTPFDTPPPAEPTPRRLSFADALTRAKGEQAREGWAGVAVAVSAETKRGLVGVTFADDPDFPYAGYGPSTVYLDAGNGRPVFSDRPQRDSVGQRVLRALYPVHSGQVAGWPTRILTMLLGLATVALAITGFLPWWRRRKTRLASWQTLRNSAAQRVTFSAEDSLPSGTRSGTGSTDVGKPLDP